MKPIELKTLLVELICAIDANEKALDDDLEDTFAAMTALSHEVKRALYEYLEELN